MKSIKILNMSF